MAKRPCACRGRYGNACACGGTGYVKVPETTSRKDTEVYRRYVRPENETDESEDKDEITSDS